MIVMWVIMLLMLLAIMTIEAMAMAMFGSGLGCGWIFGFRVGAHVFLAGRARLEAPRLSAIGRDAQLVAQGVLGLRTLGSFKLAFTGALDAGKCRTGHRMTCWCQVQEHDGMSCPSPALFFRVQMRSSPLPLHICSLEPLTMACLYIWRSHDLQTSLACAKEVRPCQGCGGSISD